MRIDKAQVTQVLTTVTLENPQECEMLNVIALLARNKIKEDEAYGNQQYCNLPISVWYSFADKLREVASA